MERIELTRAEFENQFGFKPSNDSLGMVFCTPQGMVVTEYVFTDDEIDMAPLEIAALERLYSL